MKEKIVLVGGGGHCHSVIDVLEQTNKYEIIGIVDTNCDPDLIDYPIPANDDGVKSVQFILDNFKKVLINTSNDSPAEEENKSNE